MSNKVYAKEYAVKIIDIFEDFLDSKNITIDNPEKEDDETEAIIYGNDFDMLMNEVMDVICNLCYEHELEFDMHNWCRVKDE